jgi:hypothetical protein
MATGAYLSITEAPGFNSRKDHSSEAGLAQGVLFALMGTALGLLAGVAAAAGPWGGNPTVLADDSAHVSTSSGGSGSSSSYRAPQAAAFQSQAAQTVIDAAAPVLVRASMDAPITHKSFGALAHQAAVNSIAMNTPQSHGRASSTFSAVHAPVASTAPGLNPSEASDAQGIAPRPVGIMIEGDLTVADFDASTGTVETREGRSFSVNQAGTDGNTLAWQEYAGNVHYRCTQTGNCRLTGSGIASGAKMI